MARSFSFGLAAAILAFLLALSGQCRGQLSEKAVELAQKWSPMVWLHDDEQFYPSNVQFHLDNMEVRNKKENVEMEDPKVNTLLCGNDTESFHLNTVAHVNSTDKFEDFFYGEKDLSGIETVALILEHQDKCETIDISFPTFYPYNYAKDVCIGLDVLGKCRGFEKTVMNHVGDWEHTEIRFQKGKPTQMYLSVHSFGALYTYDEGLNRFKFSSGETVFQLNKTAQNPEPNPFVVPYALYVNVLDKTHPEVFSAKGSHGTWGKAGVYPYFDFALKLEDECGRGTKWDFGQNMHLVDLSEGEEEREGTDYQWIDFRGKWGNVAKEECAVDALNGRISLLCGLTAGPTGPAFKGFKFGDPTPDDCKPKPSSAPKMTTTTAFSSVAVLVGLASFARLL